MFLALFRRKGLNFACFNQSICLAQLWTGKNNGGQADLSDTFPRERQSFSVISIPAAWSLSWRILVDQCCYRSHCLLELLTQTRESKDSRVQAGLVSLSPLQRTRETRQSSVRSKDSRVQAGLVSLSPLQRTRETRQSSVSVRFRCHRQIVLVFYKYFIEGFSVPVFWSTSWIRVIGFYLLIVNVFYVV